MIHFRATIDLTALSLLHAAAAERVVDSRELPRLPPVEAKDALKTFKVRPGFRLELVAAEPLIRDPTRDFDDPDDRVREHAVRLAKKSVSVAHASRLHPESPEPSPVLVSSLLRMTNDPSARVHYQLAFTLGEVRHLSRIEALAAIVRRDAGDSWVRASVLSSLAEGTGEMFRLISARTDPSQPRPAQGMPPRPIRSRRFSANLSIMPTLGLCRMDSDFFGKVE